MNCDELRRSVAAHHGEQEGRRVLERKRLVFKFLAVNRFTSGSCDQKICRGIRVAKGK